MKLSHLIPALVLIITICSCHQHQPIEKKAIDSLSNKNLAKIDTTTIKPAMKILRDSSIQNISVGKGFIIKIINYNKPEYYQYMEIDHNNRKVFSDTSNTYIFENKLYPILIQVDGATFELLLEKDNRPSEDLGILFTIVNDKIIKKEQLPGFTGKKVLADNETECYGYWDSSEEWEEGNKRYITYNPILYYKLTNQGIKLDSPLTTKENQRIYGRFYGFDYTDKIGFPVKGHGKIDTTAKNVLKKRFKKV